MEKNQNYSELKWNFADFINTIDEILVKDNSNVDFMIELISNSLNDGIENPFNTDNKNNLKRYLNSEKLPKPKARLIKKNFSRKKLASYFDSLFKNSEDEQDVNDLCCEFFPNDENVTFKNLAEELTKLFFQIVRKRIQEKDRRNQKTENLSSLEDEKDFEKKLKETVKTLCNIKSANDIEEYISSVTYIERKIPDDYFLCCEVQNYVTKFYKKINQFFCEEQKEGAIPSDFILKSVNNQYKKLKENITSKQEIFDSMVNYFLTKTGLSDSYFRYMKCIVAYFVQLCEVFDVTTK